MFGLVWALSWPIAEVVFRIMGDHPSDDLASLYMPFGSGSYKLRPGIDTKASWAAGTFTVHTDGLGLRCDEQRCLAVGQGERVDVLFLGDSQGFGNGVSFEESVCGVAAQLARRDGLRVANACVGGHAALNQLELARWLCETQHLSARTYVLLATPVLVRNADGFTRARVGADGRLYEDSESHAARARLWARTHTVLYCRVRDAIRNLGIGAKPKGDAPLAFGLYHPDGSDSGPQARFRALLRKLEQFAHDHQAQLKVVYLPLTLEADFDYVRTSAKASGLDLDSKAPSRICAAACEGLGISDYDLHPVLEELHARGDPLRLKGDFHYDRVLSKACGTRLYEVLKDSNLSLMSQTR